MANAAPCVTVMREDLEALRDRALTAEAKCAELEKINRGLRTRLQDLWRAAKACHMNCDLDGSEDGAYCALGRELDCQEAADPNWHPEENDASRPLLDELRALRKLAEIARDVLSDADHWGWRKSSIRELYDAVSKLEAKTDA